MKKIFLSLFILLPVFILSACNDAKVYDIITTDYVAYDFAKAIVGDHLSVKLIAPVGADYHQFEPTSQDLVEIRGADVFIYLGFEHNTWLVDDETLNGYLKNDALALNLSELTEHDHHEDEEEIHDEDDDDHLHGEHFWTNPETAVKVIDALAHELAEKYPAYEEVFEANGHAYVEAIETLAHDFKDFLSDFDEVVLFYVGHNALQGFESYFDIHVHALEDTVNPGTDVTSEQVIAFTQELTEKQVKYLFVEEVKSRYTAEVIRDQIGNIIILELHGYHTVSGEDWKNGITYKDLLERNINNIKEALLNE